VSEENVELVRRFLGFLRESYQSGAATDGLVSLCAPDIHVDASRRVFNPAVYEGLPALGARLKRSAMSGRTSTNGTSSSSTRGIALLWSRPSPVGDA
jgi:hypothetical protein